MCVAAANARFGCFEPRCRLGVVSFQALASMHILPLAFHVWCSCLKAHDCMACSRACIDRLPTGSCWRENSTPINPVQFSLHPGKHCRGCLFCKQAGPPACCACYEPLSSSMYYFVLECVCAACMLVCVDRDRVKQVRPLFVCACVRVCACATMGA